MKKWLPKEFLIKLFKSQQALLSWDTFNFITAVIFRDLKINNFWRQEKFIMFSSFIRLRWIFNYELFFV